MFHQVTIAPRSSQAYRPEGETGSEICPPVGHRASVGYAEAAIVQTRMRKRGPEREMGEVKYTVSPSPFPSSLSAWGGARSQARQMLEGWLPPSEGK